MFGNFKFQERHTAKQKLKIDVSRALPVVHLIIKKREELITTFLKTLFIIVKTVRIKYMFYFINCNERYVAINCKALYNKFLNINNNTDDENNIKNDNAAITSE